MKNAVTVCLCLVCIANTACVDDPSGPEPDCPNPEASMSCPDEPGNLVAWDSDGDGISTPVEINLTNVEYGFDTTVVDANPSRACGIPSNGFLENGLNLAELASVVGYYHHIGADQVDEDDWGTLALLSDIESTARCWSDHLEDNGHVRPRVGILDLGVKQGGPFPPHVSHQNGLDVDVRYVRNDRREIPLDLLLQPTLVDWDGATELMRCFISQSAVTDIFVNPVFIDSMTDPTLLSTNVFREIGGHHNHFHVRLQDPDGSN